MPFSMSIESAQKTVLEEEIMSRTIQQEVVDVGSRCSYQMRARVLCPKPALADPLNSIGHNGREDKLALRHT